MRASRKFKIYKNARRELGTRYPEAFPRKGPRPVLKVGIIDDIRRGGELAMTVTQCRLFLRIWTSSTAYLKAVHRGGMRVDLAGAPSGFITPVQIGDAREVLRSREKIKTVDATASKT